MKISKEFDSKLIVFLKDTEYKIYLEFNDENSFLVSLNALQTCIERFVPCIKKILKKDKTFKILIICEDDLYVETFEFINILIRKTINYAYDYIKKLEDINTSKKSIDNVKNRCKVMIRLNMLQAKKKYLKNNPNSNHPFLL